MNKRVIGIAGLAGSGKDTVAQMIVNALPGTEIVSFAAPMKEFVEAVFQFPREMLYGPSHLRSNILPSGGAYWSDALARFWALGGAFHKEWLDACGMCHGTGGNAFVDWFSAIRRECENDPDKLTPRHVLQQLGSDFGRKFIHPDVWSNVAWHRIQKAEGRVFVIPDVRFDNEAQPILNAGGHIWRVIRRGVASSRAEAAHVSEQGIDPKWVTATFPNFGSLDSLRDRVRDELYYLGLT